LVRNPRLSVMPVGYDEFFTLLDLCETTIWTFLRLNGISA
jgi:hypothetical protein